MLKYKIQISPTGSDLTVPVGFKNEVHLSGLSQDIENLVTNQTQLAINPEQDGEKRRFVPTSSSILTANFWNGSSYVSNVSPLDFPSVTAVTTDAYINSFYVCQFYDTTNEYVQTLHHTGYINGFQFTNGITSQYSWNNMYEYSDIHLPKYFLDTITANTFSMYFKLNFYSAATGKVHPFHHVNPVNSESDIYFQMSFNLTGRTYTMGNSSFYEFTNPAYVAQVNSNIESTNILKANYPSGNTFTVTGQYITI